MSAAKVASREKPGSDAVVEAAAKPAFVSRFVGQPSMALGDRAVADVVARIEPFIERVEFREEFISEAISVIVGERRIRSGSDLIRRLTFGRPALEQLLFEATRGRSLDLISAGQALVNDVRDLVMREKAGELRPFVPAPVRKQKVDVLPGMPTKSDQVRKAWERIKPAPEGFGVTAKRISL
ncbi:hypothetical protein GGE65_006262 [Skermanella aerolata]|uniref:hypothetical protein n=1 Tax=Skermanella aerolata TaxID=393310 RepID=UPI003D20D9E7